MAQLQLAHKHLWKGVKQANSYNLKTQQIEIVGLL